MERFLVMPSKRSETARQYAKIKSVMILVAGSTTLEQRRMVWMTPVLGMPIVFLLVGAAYLLCGAVAWTLGWPVMATTECKDARLIAWMLAGIWLAGGVLFVGECFHGIWAVVAATMVAVGCYGGIVAVGRRGAPQGDDLDAGDGVVRAGE